MYSFSFHSNVTGFRESPSHGRQVHVQRGQTHVQLLGGLRVYLPRRRGRRLREADAFSVLGEGENSLRAKIRRID